MGINQTYRILCLTDHQAHGKTNSMYELVQAMHTHPRCESLDVATRGLEANRDFFYNFSTTDLCVHPVTPSFSFEKMQDRWQTGCRWASIQDYDIILLRLPRPIPAGFFDYLTAHFPESSIINRPSGIIETGNKAYLLNVSDLCPPIKMCYQLEDIEAFKTQFSIVLKPLENYGGRGILRISGDTVWDGDTQYPYQDFKSSYLQSPIPYLAMKFMEGVGKGDKRVIVAGGKILGASLRKPPSGSWMCNVAQGGSSHFSEVDAHERVIADRLSSLLMPKGIVLFGFDTLADEHDVRMLSEINTLSVGGLAQATKLSGRPVVQHAADAIWRYIDTREL